MIWSPRHDISLYGMTTPVTLLEQEGVNVALATSWQVTGSMSLHRELQARSSQTRRTSAAASIHTIYLAW